MEQQTPQTPQDPETPQAPQPQQAPQKPNGLPNPGPAANKKNNLPLLIGLAAGAFFLLICALVAIWFLFLRGPKVLEYDRGTIVSEYVDATTDSGHNAAKIRDARQEGSDRDILKFALYWDVNEDIDLMVVQPNNREIYYLNTNDSETRARMYDDAHSGSSSPEVITFARPEEGKYDVFARVPELTHKINVTLVVMDRDEYTSYDIEIDPAKKDDQYVSYYLLASLDFDGEYTYIAADPVQHDYAPGDLVDDYWEIDWETVDDPRAVRRARSLSGSNNLKIALFWDSDADMDLVINTATGEDIYYGNRSGNGGGHHSGDNMGQGNGSQEYAYWSNPEAGLYDIFVRSLSLGHYDEVPVTVVVLNQGDATVYKATLSEPPHAGLFVAFKVAGIYVN